MIRTDKEIKQDVLDELAWQPNIDETQFGVIVKDGVVTIIGTVNSHAKKLAAEKAVKGVLGVRAVAEKIEVKYASDKIKTDSEIAKAAADALRWNTVVPDNKISINVEEGQIHLSGEVKWAYQKEAAKKALVNLLGVKAITDDIKIKQKVIPSEVREKITHAFERAANIDSSKIKIEVSGHRVKLSGTVCSMK